MNQLPTEKHDTRALLVVEELFARGRITPELARKVDAYEAHLVASAQDWLSQPEWECLYRAVEVGYYLAHRNSDYFTHWVTSLVATSTPTGFFSKYAQSEPVFLLGIEGLTGILLMLEAMARLTQESVLCEILQDGLHYLLSFRREVDFSAHQYAVFPRLANVADQTSPWTSFLGWSGSDLMQALLFYRSAALLSDTAWRKTADLVGLNTLLRKETTEAAVNSVNFYQGTAGIAQCYQALYQVSRQEAYRQGYEYWIARTVQQLSDDDVASSYEDHDLWHGGVGIALTLLSYHHAKDWGWEKVTLL